MNSFHRTPVERDSQSIDSVLLGRDWRGIPVDTRGFVFLLVFLLPYNLELVFAESIGFVTRALPQDAYLG